MNINIYGDFRIYISLPLKKCHSIIMRIDSLLNIKIEFTYYKSIFLKHLKNFMKSLCKTSYTSLSLQITLRTVI